MTRCFIRRFVGSPVSPVGTSPQGLVSALAGLWVAAGLASAQVLPTDLGLVSPVSGEAFGAAADLSGETAVVAAPTGAVGLNSVGARFVRIYQRNASAVWELTKTLAADTAAGLVGNYADKVALEGNTLVVAAPTLFYAAAGSGYDGRVFIHFRNQGGTNNWGLVKAINGSAPGFGAQVALDGDTLAVRVGGAPSQVRIFQRNTGGANQWGQVAIIEGPEESGGGIIIGGSDSFAETMSLDGDTLVCGNPGSNASSANGVYIYERHHGGTNTWGLKQQITGSDLGTLTSLGRSVAVSGATMAVGGVRVTLDPSLSSVSATPLVQFFTRAASGQWLAGAQLMRPDPALVAGSFGFLVALEGDRCVVAAMEQSTATRQRQSLAVYQRAGGTWSLSTTFTGGSRPGQAMPPGSLSLFSYGAANQFPGFSLVGDGNRILTGGETVTGVGQAQLRENSGSVWVASPVLTPANPHSVDFGQRLAASGRYLAVADPEDNEIAPGSGAVWVFSRETSAGDTWVPWRKIKAPVPTANARFGSSVALTGTSSSYLLAVGCPEENGQRGAVYTITSTNAVTRLAPSALAAGDRFGESVGLDSEAPSPLSRISYLAVGAPSDDVRARNAGAVYFYVRAAGADWEPPVKQYGDGPQANDGFGYSVAVSYPRVAVGAWLRDNRGAAFIYRKATGGANVWNLERALTVAEPRGLFGSTLALHENTLAVGTFHLTSGAVYVFDRNVNTGLWGLSRTLLSSQSNDGFGQSVALEGDLLAVGAAAEDVAATNTGAAHLYHRHRGGANTWGLLRSVRPVPAEAAQAFGRAVSLGRGVLGVGAPHHDTAGPDAGAARMLRFGSYELWAESRHLTAFLDNSWLPGEDPDRDGHLNLEEFAMNSDPADPRSRPAPLFEYEPASSYKIGLRLNKPDYPTDGLLYEGEGLSAERTGFIRSYAETITDSATRFHVRWNGAPPAAGAFLRFRFTYPSWP